LVDDREDISAGLQQLKSITKGKGVMLLPRHPIAYTSNYNCAAHLLDCLLPPPYPVGLPGFSEDADEAAELTAGTAGTTGPALGSTRGTEVTLVSAGTAAASTPAARAVASEARVEAIDVPTAATGEVATAAVSPPPASPPRATASSPAYLEYR
jgi:hypothetical protein